MKNQKLWMLISCMGVTMACNQTTKSISGIYVINSKNEYTILSDTLVITDYNLSAATYQIEKRSGYNLIRGGSVLPKEFKRKSWNATFDDEKQVLLESEFGRRIYVNRDAGTVSFGGTYKKVK